MPTVTQHFILEGRYLGSALRSTSFSRRDSCGGVYERVPLSYAFFCPVCAEVWARCPVELPNGTQRQFFALTLACRKHEVSAWQVPGALQCGSDEDFFAAFPDEVVKWEFERHLEWCERIGNDNNDNEKGTV